MRLADFILANTSTILAEWDVFALDTWPNDQPSAAGLRDHAEEILLASARDMKSAQTPSQQSEKSHGRGESDESGDGSSLDGASMDHATGRVASGFSLPALVAEYRALRASVIRLWSQSARLPDVEDLLDLTRFNEAIDQSLAETVRGYTRQVDEARQLFLAILGHDLRNPLNAIMLSAQSLQDADVSPAALVDLKQIQASSDAMARMLNDFLDFAGTRLGKQMPVNRTTMDLTVLGLSAIREIRAAYPTRTVRMDARGNLTGEWDAARLRQLLSNLLGNAVEHGAAAHPVDLTITGGVAEVVLVVTNQGTPIPVELLPRIFDPLVRGVSPENRANFRPGSMGLGLYISRQVVLAHGGAIKVTSSAEGSTSFTVHLPRKIRNDDGSTKDPSTQNTGGQSAAAASPSSTGDRLVRTERY